MNNEILNHINGELQHVHDDIEHVERDVQELIAHLKTRGTFFTTRYGGEIERKISKPF